MARRVPTKSHNRIHSWRDTTPHDPPVVRHVGRRSDVSLDSPQPPPPGWFGGVRSGGHRTCGAAGVVSLRVLHPHVRYRVDCDRLEVGQGDLAPLAQGQGLHRGQGQLLGLALALGQLEALQGLDPLHLNEEQREGGGREGSEKRPSSCSPMRSYGDLNEALSTITDV